MRPYERRVRGRWAVSGTVLALGTQHSALSTVNDLPVPRYFGSSWNQATARYELFLGYVDDWNLKYHDLEHWFTAARRLAHLHAHFATQAAKLQACEFLLRFDANYFCEWANRAIATVAGRSVKLAVMGVAVPSNWVRGGSPTMSSMVRSMDTVL